MLMTTWLQYKMQCSRMPLDIRDKATQNRDGAPHRRKKNKPATVGDTMALKFVLHSPMEIRFCSCACPCSDILLHAEVHGRFCFAYDVTRPPPLPHTQLRIEPFYNAPTCVVRGCSVLCCDLSCRRSQVRYFSRRFVRLCL